MCVLKKYERLVHVLIVVPFGLIVNRFSSVLGEFLAVVLLQQFQTPFEYSIGLEFAGSLLPNHHDHRPLQT